ncbi:sensor histidine kinase [Paenibacillus timonensis]|uniref:ATP-binding protein n=1 Tax=Paenibacillus timonensis TaxID=225915 RepID=UPI0022E55719|nr:sensor histidine kinase [Paenibacillus timonensis]
MSKFSAMARILSHLGDQLISNSAVALLELIKNSYDAGSPKVEIVIDQKMRTMIVKDSGKGMDKQDIENKYLVIGTNNRHIEHKLIRNNYESNLVNNNNTFSDKEAMKESPQVPLGEKGLGRFATMKLARKVVVLTKKKSSEKGSLLLLNWNKFNNDSTKRLDEIGVHLFDVNNKELEDSGYKGSFTLIKLYDLKDFCEKEEWNEKRFSEFYKTHFMKYLNPFKPNDGFQIKFEVYAHDGKFFRFTPASLDKHLLDQAHYKLTGTIQNNNLYSDYYIRGADGKQHTGILSEYISELDGLVTDKESEIGPIKFEFYFFNRRGDRLKDIKVKGYSKISDLRKLIDQYNGGIMIYRDNFRVLPYAESGDDWLNMDKDSQFRSEGIRFNTIQTVGAIFISTLDNPNLRDQTNREGLIHNKAYEALYKALRSTLSFFKNQIEIYYPKASKKKGPITTENLHEALSPFGTKINEIRSGFERITPYLNTNDPIIKNLIGSFNSNFSEIDNNYIQIRNSISELEQRVEEVEDQQRMILDLAGVGLTAETVAHEIRSYLGRMESYLTDLLKKIPSQKDNLYLLISNTKSLDSVVSRLDVQAVTKRRTKSKINVLRLIEDLCKSKLYIWSLEEGNTISINVKHDDSITYLKANQGMLVQVFDNLLNNSHYWLLKYSKGLKDFSPEIKIHIYADGTIEYCDNGRGISPIDKEAIFEPFFSRKEGGRGLGLYIISEILAFHESEIYLSEKLNRHGNFFKFVVDLSKTTV